VGTGGIAMPQGRVVGGPGGLRVPPGVGGGQAGVAAFGEVAEGEEGPDEGGARSPGVQGG
jgi:hypothetical protein